jgi:hypothetical protein
VGCRREEEEAEGFSMSWLLTEQEKWVKKQRPYASIGERCAFREGFLAGFDNGIRFESKVQKAEAIAKKVVSKRVKK